MVSSAGTNAIVLQAQWRMRPRAYGTRKQNGGHILVDVASFNLPVRGAREVGQSTLYSKVPLLVEEDPFPNPILF